ncbi:MAG TPA: transaldolase family protein [Polyangiaceae bacterium]
MLFIDSSNPKEIRELYQWGVASGVTTNPLIISREAGDAELKSIILEILEVSTGHVSVELTTEIEGEMLEEALGYHAWSPERICVKVPFSETGLRVLHQLVTRKVTTNVTCLMNFNQAYLSALTGATYVSLFAGRIRDMGYDVRPIIAATRAVLDREGLKSRIIVGSLRQVMDVSDALEQGAHIVTVPPDLVRKMLYNPRTESTIREFNEAWAKRRQR